MSAKKKVLLATLLCAVTAGLVLYKQWEPKKTTTVVEHPVNVETTAVKTATLADRFTTLGSLASTDSIDISSEIAGQIAKIHFKPGDRVKKGQLLISLDSTIYESELASAKASLKLSEMNFKRTNQLAQRRLSSEQALDQSLADLKEKENLVRVKEAQFEKTRLKAPFDGTLGSRHISIGQYVNVAQPLVHLVANQTMRIEYQLPERYLSKLKKGQKVTLISDAFPDEPFHGVVHYIDPTIDKDTRTVAVEALIDNSNHRLYSGLFVRVTHQFSNKKKRLLIPEESIIPGMNNEKVFLIQDNKAKAINITTGDHHAQMVEVTSGLKPDDRIIVRGQHKLKDGSLVIDARLS